MNPPLKLAWRLCALGAGLWALACPAAWSQASHATAPTSAHVHGASANTQTDASSSLGSPASAGQPSLNWQDANRAVAQFPRGHVDLLRWEQTKLPPWQDPPAHPDAGQLSLERATQRALQDEAKWLLPGMSAMERAEVRQQVAGVRRDVQKIWVDAVVSRQSVAHSRDILAVAQAGAELGQRMAQVGNWSRARQLQEELPLLAARTRLDKAQLQADRALLALWQRVGTGMTVEAVAQQLPVHLPLQLPLDQRIDVSAAVREGRLGPTALDSAAPVKALQEQALEAHLRWSLQDLNARRLMASLGLSDADLQRVQNALSAQAGQDVPVWDPRMVRWGHGFESAWQARLKADRLARQVRADVQLALTAYQVALQNAQHTQADLLRLHTELSQQTQLRYNGMLQSTWDLLAYARSRIDSVDAALLAQRQTWLAHADLMAVLAGLPYSANEQGSAEAPETSAFTTPAGH